MLARTILEFASAGGSVEIRLPPDGNLDVLDVSRVSVDALARPGDLAWISSATVKSAPHRVGEYHGTLLVLPLDGLHLVSDRFIAIGTEAPKGLFSRIIAQFFAHLSAIDWPTAAVAISPDAQVGQRVTLAPGVVIGSRVELGDDVSIGPNTCIANAVIGHDVTIGCNCSIGLAGFGYSKDEEGAWVRFPHIGGVRIESGVEIGSNTCIDRGSIGDTVIRRFAKIDNLVHVAHNCDIGESALLIANSMIGGSSTVGPKAWIAPSSAINNKLNVGAGATVGTGAIVIRNVQEGATVVGNPAKPLNK